MIQVIYQKQSNNSEFNTGLLQSVLRNDHVGVTILLLLNGTLHECYQKSKDGYGITNVTTSKCYQEKDICKKLLKLTKWLGPQFQHYLHDETNRRLDLDIIAKLEDLWKLEN